MNGPSDNNQSLKNKIEEYVFKVPGDIEKETHTAMDNFWGWLKKESEIWASNAWDFLKSLF